MKNDKPMISVIIPVYNAEKYLRRTIDSVLQQSFTDYEIIMVDDGSTDSSYDICNEIAENSDNIRLFKQENSGCAGARKLGAEEAGGEFLFFLDADDTLHKDCLKTLYEPYHDNDVDIVIGYFVRQTEAGEVLPVNCRFRTGEFWDNKTVIPVTGKKDITDLALKSWRYSGDGLFSSLVCRLFKRDFFLKIRSELHEGVRAGEDFLLNIKLLKSVNKVIIINKPLYYYTIRNSGTSLSCGILNKPDYLENYSIMHSGVTELLMENYRLSKHEAEIEAYRAISYQLIGNIIYNFKFYNKENSKEFYKKLARIINSKLAVNAVRYHKVLEGYSKLVPFLMRMRWTGGLVYLCVRRAKKRYS